MDQRFPTHNDQRAADGGDPLADGDEREPFRCIACGGPIEKVLADLGSLTCHDHRPIRR